MALAQSEGGSPSSRGCYYSLAENLINSQVLFLLGSALSGALQGASSQPQVLWAKEHERLLLLSPLQFG